VIGEAVVLVFGFFALVALVSLFPLTLLDDWRM
jgi:hypothetical protein